VLTIDSNAQYQVPGSASSNATLATCIIQLSFSKGIYRIEILEYPASSANDSPFYLPSSRAFGVGGM
jgi:hypothetical protein